MQSKCIGSDRKLGDYGPGSEGCVALEMDTLQESTGKWEGCNNRKGAVGEILTLTSKKNAILLNRWSGFGRKGLKLPKWYL